MAALVLAGCAGESASRVIQPSADPELRAEVAPPVPTPPAAPPPVCEVDTLRVFSPDGGRLAVLHDAGGISVYETKSWALSASFATRKVQRMFFAGARLFFTEELEGKKELYRVQVSNESSESVFELSNAQSGWMGAQLAASEDGRLLLVPVLDDTRTPDDPAHVLTRVELWDVPSKEKLFSYPLPEEDSALSLVVAKTGHALVGARRLSLFAPGSQKPERTWDYRQDPEPTFSHDGSLLAFRNEVQIYVYGLRDKKLRTLKDRDCDGQGVAWSPDDKTLAIGGFAFHACLFDPRTGRLRHTLPNPRVSTQTFEDEGMREPLGWSNDGRALLTKGLFELVLFDVKGGRPHDLTKLGTAGWTLSDTRIQPRARDGALLVLHQGRLQAHVLGGRLIGDVVDGEPWRQLAVSADGERFLRFVERLEVVPTDAQGRVVPLDGTEPDKDAFGDTSFLFDPAGKFVISGDGPLRVWSAETGKRVGPKRDERCPER